MVPFYSHARAQEGGARHPEVADEFYLAVLKQCNEIPTDSKTGATIPPDALERAVLLLSLCLTVFPPSAPEVADRLFWWLRQPVVAVRIIGG